jgi:DNA replication protein DnaC
MNMQTMKSLKAFRLPAMANEYKRQEELPAMASLPFDDRLSMMTNAEETARYDKKVSRFLRQAHLREAQASLENVDFRPERKLDKAQVARLSDCRWIKEARSMLITGPCGTGKTYLASAFGNAACRLGFSVRSYRVPRLLIDLQISRGDGSWNKLLADLKKPDLLILDDFGLSNLDTPQCRDFLEVIEDRYKSKAVLIASQLPVASWYSLFADPTIADAVLDRLLQGAYRFELSGPSLRSLPANTGTNDLNT